MSISFYGNYRPLHLPACDLATLKRYLKTKVMDGAILEAALKVIKDFERQRKAGISIVSAGSEGHGLAIGIRKGQRDTWLDEITDKMEMHPQLNYEP